MGAGSGLWGVNQQRDSDGAVFEDCQYSDPSKLVPLLHKRPSGPSRASEERDEGAGGTFSLCNEKRRRRRCVIGSLDFCGATHIYSNIFVRFSLGLLYLFYFSGSRGA